MVRAARPKQTKTKLNQTRKFVANLTAMLNHFKTALTHSGYVNECELKEADKALLAWDDSCLGFPSHPEIPSTNWPISVFLTQLLQLL